MVSAHQINRTNNTDKSRRKIKMGDSQTSAQQQLRQEKHLSQLYNSVLMSSLSEATRGQMIFISYQLTKTMIGFINFSAKRSYKAITINMHSDVMHRFVERDLTALSRERIWLRLKTILLWFRNLPNRGGLSGKPLCFII